VTVRIGFFQFAPRFGRPDENCRAVVRALGGVDAELIVLPELAFTGYRFRDRKELSGLAEDPRFQTATERSKHHEALDDVIARWAGAHPLAHIEKLLADAGVPATRVFTIADIFGDPHYQARGSIVRAS